MNQTTEVLTPDQPHATWPVLLVHGIFDSSKIFRRMAVWLSKHGLRPLAPDLAPNSGASGLDELAIQLRSFADDNLPHGQPFDLVGFSMGGIVARRPRIHLSGCASSMDVEESTESGSDSAVAASVKLALITLHSD